MKSAFTIAKDGSGKLAVLFLGDKKQMPTADAIFHDNAALLDAGLSGEIEVAVFRSPLPYRRRVVTLESTASESSIPARASEIAPRPRGRPRKNPTTEPIA